MTDQLSDHEDHFMRIAHARPFTDLRLNIAQILARGLEGLPENDGSRDWMENVVGICLEAIAEAVQLEPENVDELVSEKLPHQRTTPSQPEPEVAGPITDGRPMNQSYWLALLRHDAYAASFQSVDQYRSALIERASSPRAQPEPAGDGLSDDAIEADFRSWYNDRYHHHYFGAISLVKCIEWTREALTRYATPQPSPVPAPMSADTLAAIIREVDGTHRLGAAALAEAVLAHPAAINAQSSPVPMTERLPELRGMFERILCVARSSGGLTVGNIQLADRLIDAVVSWSGDALPVPGAEVPPMPVPGDAEGLAEVFWGRYAQPEPEGPTDEELYQFWESRPELGLTCDEPVKLLRAGLTRYARPTIKPVPVAERPWEREGWCDAEGFCWDGSGWTYDDANEVEGYAIWALVPANKTKGDFSLPHHALPVPGAEVQS